MAKKSTTQITVTTTGDGINSTNAPLPLVNSTQAPSGGPESRTLGIGDNTLTVPDGAIGMVFVPPTTGTGFRLKGDVADVGFELAPTEASFVALPPLTASVIIGADAADVVFIQFV